MLYEVSSRTAMAVGGCFWEVDTLGVRNIGLATARVTIRIINILMISSRMFLSLLRLFSCSLLSLINLMLGNTTLRGFFLANNHMSNGRMVAAEKKSRDMFRKLSSNTYIPKLRAKRYSLFAIFIPGALREKSKRTFL